MLKGPVVKWIVGWSGHRDIQFGQNIKYRKGITRSETTSGRPHRSRQVSSDFP